MKYIVVYNVEADKEFPILFPDELRHDHVAKIHRVSENILRSAGHCSIKGGIAVAWGYSVTLEKYNKPSRPEDSGLIAKYILGSDSQIPVGGV